MTFSRLKQGRWAYDIVAILILLSGITFFHWRGIQPGHTFIPVDLANQLVPWRQTPLTSLQNPLISDPLQQYFPFINAATSLLQTERHWPLWNPYVFAGHPMLADPLSQPFYPVMPLLSLWVGTARAFAVGLWAQVCLAALFTYGWLRMSRFKYIQALAGAFTYALSGYLVTWFETTFWLSSISLLPGVLLLFETTLRARRVAFLGVAAGLIGLAFLGGQVQFTLVFILFGGVYALGRAWNYRQRDEEKWWLPAIYFAFIAFTGVLLAGIFLLPFIEFVTLSHRYAGDGAALTGRLPWQHLITLILPDFYGNPTTSGYWGYSGNYSEWTIYVGVVAFFLSGLTILHRKNPATRSILFITALVFYLVLGGPGVSSLSFLPGISYLTLNRIAFILPLFFAWLTASALTLPIIEKRATLIWAGLCAVVIIAAVFTATEHWEQIYPTVFATVFWLTLTISLIFLRPLWPQHRSWFNLGFVVLIFADLYIWGHTYSPTGKVVDLMPPTPGITYLQQQIDLSQHRILVFQRHDQTLVGMGNSLSSYSLPVAGGNSSLVTNRYLQLAVADDPEIDIWWAAKKDNTIAYSYPSARLLDLLGITHLVAAEPLPYPDLQTELLQDDCSQTIPAPADGQPITGSFVPRHSAINRLDIKIRGKDGDSDGMLTVQLKQEAETPRLVLEEQVALSVDDAEQTLTLFFAPEREAPGKTYTWSLRLEPKTTTSAICADKQGNPAVSFYGTTWGSSYADEFYIYERLPVLPKAYVVYAAETIPDDNQAVARLLDDDFATDRQAITAVPVPLANRHPFSHTPVTITSYQSDRIVMTATTTETGLLILRDQYHPGWKATIDGQETSVQRANHVLRGVVLPPGTHEVVFTFQPTSLSMGIAVSGLGLFLLLAGLLLLQKIGFLKNNK